MLGLTLGPVGATLGLASAWAAVTVYASRVIVTPPRRRDDDLEILGVAEDATTVRLRSTPETRVEGRYGLWFSGDAGFARLGDIVARDSRSVTRVVEEVVRGDLRSARSGRWSGWFYLAPDDLGLEAEHVRILTPVGAAPAWLLPPGGTGGVPQTESGSGRWAILVHGRAVSRSETLRAVESLHADGRTVLSVSYRNDGEAPDSADGRYSLGLREWGDVDAALSFARSRGARDVVLMGWSMGGGIVLQTATSSRHRDLVSGVALDSPAVDWRAVVDHQVGTLRHLPALMARSVRLLLSAPLLSRAAGLQAPLDFSRLDFVARAGELERPVLVLHSDGDDFVPPGPSWALAAARPDLVTFVAFDTAKHTRLWNHDPERWTSAISRWLQALAPSQAASRTDQRA